jgi:terminase small subunit / prophage DNA-packing protein
MVDQKGVNELAIELDIAPSTVSIKRRKGKTDKEIRLEAEEFKNKPVDKSLQESQRRKELALAELRELELAKAKGELAPVKELNQHFATGILRARDILLRIPAELADRLAQTSDPIEVKNLLRAEIHRALKQLSEYK